MTGPVFLRVLQGHNETVITTCLGTMKQGWGDMVTCLRDTSKGQVVMVTYLSWRHEQGIEARTSW